VWKAILYNTPQSRNRRVPEYPNQVISCDGIEKTLAHRFLLIRRVLKKGLRRRKRDASFPFAAAEL
jgi:hypothetical protein